MQTDRLPESELAALKADSRYAEQMQALQKIGSAFAFGAIVYYVIAFMGILPSGGFVDPVIWKIFAIAGLIMPVFLPLVWKIQKEKLGASPDFESASSATTASFVASLALADATMIIGLLMPLMGGSRQIGLWLMLLGVVYLAGAGVYSWKQSERLLLDAWRREQGVAA